jgi:hypothetical protein
MKKYGTGSMLHETRCRAERVTEGRGDVRGSAGKRGSATHDLRVRPSHAGKCPLGRTSRTETCKREPQDSASPQSFKQGKNRQAKDRHSPTKQLPTSTAVCGPGRREQRSRRERAGGAVVVEDRPRVVVLAWASGSPSCAASQCSCCNVDWFTSLGPVPLIPTGQAFPIMNFCVSSSPSFKI